MERAGNYPAWQLSKMEERRLSISGTLFPATGKGLSARTDLEFLALETEPLPLVSGTGEVLGDYVVLSLNFDHDLLLDNGKAQQIDFTMELAEYAENIQK